MIDGDMETWRLRIAPASLFCGSLVVQQPKEPRSRINPLEPDQVQHLLAAAPQYQRALLLVLVSTGLRRSEAFGLTWGAVDLDKGELHVRHQLQGGKLVDTKTGAGERTIPLATATIAALRDRQTVCPWTEPDLMFTTDNGKPLNPSNFYKRIWAPVKKAAGLPEGTTLHQLR